jgi:DNA-binding NtrC family response regulator
MLAGLHVDVQRVECWRMASGRLLVVAQGDDLRGSLVFALEAEGFEVTARSDLPELEWVTSRRFDCTVLDQKVLIGKAYQSIAFCIKAHPVVLLAARPHGWLVEWVSQVIETPAIDDDALNTAVRLAMHIQG